MQRHPYREGLHAGLMRALYQLGRPADALAAFRKVRRLLRDELGTEPGEELQGLHKAILNRDPSLKVTGTATPQVYQPIPRELPPAATCFVGRKQETARLAEALSPPDRMERHRPPVVLLYGPGGVGKSALAVRVAHEVANDYPDGQLYVDLCGSTPGRQPVPPAEVLSRFLRRLGVAPGQIPPDTADAAALLRSVCAGRRLLLVLDNAVDKDQVAPLLPGSPACGVIVTSRHRLSSLDADRRVRVPVLANNDGLALLSGLTDGPATDPEAVQAIVALSGGLPLAIRIAGGRLTSRPDVSATEYAQRLADRSRRLDELRLDDLAVRASIRTSYDTLQSSADPTERLAARTFRVLGLLHVPDVAPRVVAAMLTESNLDSTRAAMDRLVDVQLLEPLPGGRYGLHDLVRLVATETATTHDSQSSRDRALQRAMEYYGATSVLAGELLHPGRSWVFEVPPTTIDDYCPTFGEPAQAKTWVDAELPSLVAAIDQVTTATTDVPRVVLRLSEEVWDYLHFRNEWQVALRLSRAALEIGRHRQHTPSAGWWHLAIGRTEANLGNYAAAKANFEQALEVMRSLDSMPGEMLTLTAMGVACHWRGEPAATLAHYDDAMKLARHHHLRSIRPALLLNMSACYISLERLDDAESAAQQSAAMSRVDGNLERLGAALNNLAGAYCLCGRLQDAVRCANEAIACSREVGDILTQAFALIARSVALLWQGDHMNSIRDALDVLDSARRRGDRYAEAMALRQQAMALSSVGDDFAAASISSRADDAYASLTSRCDPVTEKLLARNGPL